MVMTAEPNNEMPARPPTGARPLRATRVGVVTSTARQKTIQITVSYLVRHPKYGKYLKRRTVLHAHDEQNECHSGDVVEVMQCRPLSKTKRWRLVRIIRRAPQEQAHLPSVETGGLP